MSNIPSNYHTHSTFCDGKDTPEEMVLEAIRLGCPEIGFSGHSYTDFDETYCMSIEGTKQYKKCIRELAEKYRDRIRILLGVEQDYFSNAPTNGYDYVIGSVHYIKKDGVYLTVDESAETQKRDVANHYGGDFYTYIEDYYALIGDIYSKTKCNIVGHFDLVTKFNEDGSLFDTNHPRYIAASDRALQKLLATPAIFEINTGAIARGYRKTPYPEKRLLDVILQSGKKVVCNSDCHNKDNLLCGLI